MKAVIMAGGKGRRIASINADVPKPMVLINGMPVLQHQVNCLKNQGIIDIILVIGYLGHVIEKYFYDGSSFGVHITYIREETPLGSAGALYYLKNIIKEDFLLLNGDVIFDIDIKRFSRAHIGNGGLATIFTHPNNHPYDSSIVVSDSDNVVQKWMAKEEERKWYKNRVNAGLHMMSAKLLERFEVLERRDLDRDILKPLVEEKQLYVYDSPEYVKDMGTPERYYEVERDIRSGLVAGKNLSNKQKAVFLDRDGTINKYVGFLSHIEELELIDKVGEAIKRLNQKGYLVIVITNQPVIARGELSKEGLEEIHCKMETLLGWQGAYVDDIFYCPHHPDKGFVGEKIQYKVVCRCRKPKPGMLWEAARKYNIDLAVSWMVGDGVNDMEAGRAAGCHLAYLGREKINGCKSFMCLSDAVDEILKDK